MSIAALPMYDWPEVRDATDRFWRAIRQRLAAAGIDAPADLTRGDDLSSLWQSPKLLLAQTCGYPFSTMLAGKVSLVATPAYAIDCAPGRYFSVVVAHRDAATHPLDAIVTTRFAYNSRDSQSGFRAIARMIAATGRSLPRARAETGSHRASIRAVAGGEAGFAAIDAVTWELALRHEPAAGDLTVVARTPETSGLPLITSVENVPLCHRLANAIEAAIADLVGETRRTLMIDGLVSTTPDDYAPLAVPIAPAA